MPPSETALPTTRTRLGLFTPKIVTAFREGYSREKLVHDIVAGLTVAILALPLSMAIAIGAGVSPDKGLVTSVVAGLAISALGGSRFQIGGPAAAFIVIIAAIIQKHGYDGLLTATFLAGLLLVGGGLLKLGTYIKYIPGPVILGFTSGIGAIILIGQIKDFLGLKGEVPAEVLHKVAALWQMRATFNVWAFLIGAGTLAAIVALRAWRPRWPGLLISVAAGSIAVWALGLPVETIGSRFGGIPTSLPPPHLPDLSWSKIMEVLPSTFTLAFLIGIESLLSAVMADTMAGTRHRSNMEVVAQGVGNVASAMFGGMPATGVIARTGTNITAGAKTPVSGLLHAAFILLFMLVAAPLASYLALPALAAVLVSVAWRLLELKELSHYLGRAPRDDRLILLSTLVLTVLVDLNVAIAVGVVLACMLFMHRMAETPGIELGGAVLAVDDVDDRTAKSVLLSMKLPEGIRVFQFRGPLFFGAAQRISETLRELESWPRVMILRMREVPLVDATALSVLEELAETCDKHGCRIIISGIQRQPREALHRMGLLRSHRIILASNGFMAVEKAKAILEDAPSQRAGAAE